MSLIVSGHEYVALPRPEQTWLIEPLVPAGGSCLFYGPPKVGKSVAALQLASAIQEGTDWLGYPARTKGPVAYIQLDNPRSLWATRLVKTGVQLPGVLNVLQTDKEILGTYPSFDILNPAHADLLTVALRELNPVAVIFDTLIKSHSAKENDPTEMTRVMAHLTSCVRPAALIIIAHSRKAGHDDTPSVIDDNRGASSIVGEMDAIISMKPNSISIVGRAIEDTTFSAWMQEDTMWHRGKGKVRNQTSPAQSQP